MHVSNVRAGIDIDALTNELDELCSHITPSELVLRIYEMDKEHIQYVVEKYQRFVAQSEAYFDLLVKAIHHVNYVTKSGWPPHKLVQLLLINHNIKPLLSGFDRLMKGYYEDSHILLRTPYEAFFRVIFISLNPDDPYYSFAPRKKGLKQFKLTNFVTQELELDWHHYRVMSSIAHANQFSAMTDFYKIVKEGQTEPITLTFGFDENMFSMCINQLGFLLLFYLRTVTLLFLAHGHQSADVEMIDNCRKYISLYQKSFAAHINPHFRSLAKDVDDIFQMLEEVEAGYDWKEAWNRLRNC